jgi:hypothetical protein
MSSLADHLHPGSLFERRCAIGTDSLAIGIEKPFKLYPSPQQCRQPLPHHEEIDYWTRSLYVC